MNEIDRRKYEDIINNKSSNNKTSKTKRYLSGLLLRSLVVVIILISFAIIYKSDSTLKDDITSSFFREEISFTKINNIYNKYLGGILPLKNENSSTVTEVFNEKLNYSSSSIFYDGVKLTVAESYLVPSLTEGMVVFCGNKEKYGETIIIENLDGYEYWYGNISSTSLKLYDYVEKGSLVGEVNNELYMVVSKDGNYLNYEEYIY